MWGIVVKTLLTGTFSRSLDQKLRIAIPKRLRAAMAEGTGESFYVAPGTDESLSLYTAEAFGQLAKRLADVSPTRKDVRTFARLFYSQAQQVELDSQGRIRVPRELADLAGLEKEVMLLGVQDHVELWAADRWRDYLAQNQPHYDDIAEATFGAERQ